MSRILVHSVPANNLIDWAKALESVGGNRALLREITQAFLADAPCQMQTIQNAVSRGDATTARRAAHTLKGNSRYFGANAVTQAASHLEEYAAQGNCEGVDSHMDVLRQSLAAVYPLLTDYLNRDSGS